MPLFGRRKSPEDAFTEEVAALARSLLGGQVTKREPLILEIALPGRASPTTMFLHNVWQESQQDDAPTRAVRLRSAVLAMNPPDKAATWEEARGSLLPAVRGLSWAASAPKPPVSREVLPMVSLLIAVDSEHAISYVNDDDLASWGVGLDEAEEQARANLAGMAVPHERARAGWIVTGPDGYASSWLLAPDRLLQVADDLQPPVLALVPARDDVLLVSAHDPQLRERITAHIEVFQSHPRRISPQPFVLEDERASPWQPGEDHPLAGLVRQCAGLMSLYEYEDQKSRLSARFEAEGIDTFVASFGLVRGDGDAAWSWSSWGRQVTSGLLPRTDYVSFVDLEDQEASFFVPWDVVSRTVGKTLVPEPDLDPPRWRFSGWPSEAAMSRLRRAAVTPS